MEASGDSFSGLSAVWSVCCVAVQSLMPASVVCALSGHKSRLKQRLANPTPAPHPNTSNTSNYNLAPKSCCSFALCFQQCRTGSGSGHSDRSLTAPPQPESTCRCEGRRAEFLTAFMHISISSRGHCPVYSSFLTMARCQHTFRLL